MMFGCQVTNVTWMGKCLTVIKVCECVLQLSRCADVWAQYLFLLLRVCWHRSNATGSAELNFILLHTRPIIYSTDRISFLILMCILWKLIIMSITYNVISNRNSITKWFNLNIGKLWLFSAVVTWFLFHICSQYTSFIFFFLCICESKN